MDSAFYTLQDFMTFSKGVTYVLIVVALIAIVGWWQFLTGKEDD